MKRHCLRCRTIIETGSYCPACQPPKTSKRNGSTRAWRTARAQALQRDHRRCVICGAPATEVDHIQQVRDGGTDQLDNLRSLCTRHHAERHKTT